MNIITVKIEKPTNFILGQECDESPLRSELP